jgi:coenzyme PQQ precursor peptide PqqA
MTFQLVTCRRRSRCDPQRGAQSVAPFFQSLIRRVPGARRAAFRFYTCQLANVCLLCLRQHRRHTCASYLAGDGASLLEIADVLGHRSLRMTLRYAHLGVGHKRTRLAKMVDGAGEGTLVTRDADSVECSLRAPMRQECGKSHCARNALHELRFGMEITMYVANH